MHKLFHVLNIGKATAWFRSWSSFGKKALIGCTIVIAIAATILVKRGSFFGLTHELPNPYYDCALLLGENSASDDGVSLREVMHGFGYEQEQPNQLLNLLLIAHAHPIYSEHGHEKFLFAEYEWHCALTGKHKINLSTSWEDKLLGEPRFASIEDGLEQLDAYVQTAFMRPKGVEQEMLTTPVFYDKHREYILSLFNSLGYYKALEPKFKTYDGVLILSSAEGTVRNNISYLRHLLEAQAIVNPGVIYLLASDRPLWPLHEPITATLLAKSITDEELGQTSSPKIEDKINIHFRSLFTDEVQRRMDPKELVALRDQLINYYQDTYRIIWPTEAELMQRIVPPYFSEFPVKLIVAPKAPGQTRVTADDTYVAFNKMADELELTKGPEMAKLLIISHQPTLLYHYYTALSFLGKRFNLDISGVGATHQVELPVFFDSLARATYGFTRCLADLSEQQCHRKH